MNIKIGRLLITTKIIYPNNPFDLSKGEKKMLAERVLSETMGARSLITRVKAFRTIALERGWYENPNFGLRECTEWVKQHFAENGIGDIIIK